MKITFDIAGTQAEFLRNDKTGRAELRFGDDTVPLESPYRFSTHFGLGTKRVWRCRVEEHDVEIVKVRPRFEGGLRKNSFTISVDDRVVAEVAGK